MAKQLLTKKAKINAEISRISKLTDKHDAYFKIIFSHQIEKKHNFHSLSTRNKKPVQDNDAIQIYRAFGKFLDVSVQLPMSEVEKKYRRLTDTREGTYDPETGEEMQVEHYCLFEKEDKPNLLRDGVRLHGYVRTNGGYFVITKLDWHHQTNKL